MSDRLLAFTRWQINKENGQTYVDQLPSSLTALYSLSKIIWTQGESDTDETRAHYKDLIITPVRDGAQDNAFICLTLTAKDIEKKIDELSNRNTSIPAPALRSDSPITVPLLRVNVHEGILQFNRRGNKRKIKGPDLDEAKALITAINELIEEFGAGNFAVESNFEELEERYLANKNPDFGIKIP